MKLLESVKNSTDNFIRNYEKYIIAFLIILASVRIFLFNAAFPFFNNVDEPRHFDMVNKYASGEIPEKEIVEYSPGSIELIIFYETREYLNKPEQYRWGTYPPPLWVFPSAKESRYYSFRTKYWEKQRNHEPSAFPLPYLLEAQWFKVGKALGMEGGYLLYWLRFLNIPVFAFLVWFSWFMAKRFFPDEPLMSIGIPLVLAFFPQDLFYAVTSGTFSALFFGIAFFFLFQIFLRKKSLLYHAIAGLFVALGFLIKISNIAVPFLLALVVFMKASNLHKEKKLGEYIPRLTVLLLCAGIPIGAFFLRNYLVFGDITRHGEVIKYLGWTPKSFGEMWDHPIFTPGGLSFFLTELIRTFWRGEFVWHGEPMAHNWADILFISTTFLFLSVSLYSLFSKKRQGTDESRFILFMSFFSLLVSLLFLGYLSIRFDFGDWFYPSRETPYYCSGRLLSGLIIPFFILYINGIRVLFLKISRFFHPLFIILLIVTLISLSEISLTLPVFESEFNWFHLSPH